jgi:hypothetical protein
MKTFKTTQLVLLICLLFIFNSCDTSKDKREASKVPGLMEVKCPPELDYKSKYRINEYIVRIDPCAKKQWPKKVKHKIDSLKNVFELYDPDTCKCDPNLILFKSNQENPKPEERIETINDKLKTEGTVIGSATYNINLDIPDNPPPILNIKEYTRINQPIENQMIVAVIDCGIKIGQEDPLQQYLWEKPSTVLCGDDHGLNLTDDSEIENYHGSLVSRFIVNGLNPEDIKLMDLRIFNNQGEGTLFQASCAIAFAIENGADIINTSWGYYTDFKKPSYLNIIWEAKMKDIIIVASGGNDGIDTDKCHHMLSGLDNKKYKKDASNVIGVAYLNKNKDDLHENSNFGEHSISLAAEGVFEFDQNGTAITIEGSSYAAPQVTRAAAILKGNLPDFDHYQIIECIMAHNVIPVPNIQSKLIMGGRLKVDLDILPCAN